MTEDQGYKHPMSQGIYNTIEGSNYLRASAYMAIIDADTFLELKT